MLIQNLKHALKISHQLPWQKAEIIERKYFINYTKKSIYKMSRWFTIIKNTLIYSKQTLLYL